ncbi:UBP1-associated protein 2A-like [Andrographis paniculata]|uniref:UBP1-associated protein 2A-like n=1 Tax=Andrographis paniculata TaxID=175694 RepID=UPI0021E878BC|nr:UBP1-associated protein 2A-like [Andrographis paniculata]XP_051134253.1 UBP1-associated protein 2A-like [Andrographis paniculata]
MGRKRRSRAPEGTQESGLAEANEPAVETEPDRESEPQSEDTHETALGEDQPVGEDVNEEGGEGEEDGDGEERELGKTEEMDKDAGEEKMEQDSEISEKRAVSENGVEKEGEDELEEEPLEKLLEPFSKDQLTLLIKEAVARHPDIMENVHKLADADPAHCKIFVHGLGWDASTETITPIFGKYGEIEDCKVVRDKNSGKSKGYGFILYKHRDGARKALKQPQKIIDGRMTSCQLASAGPVQTPPPPAAVSTPPVSEYTQRKIYVSNVSAELDPKKLLEFFSKFGEIEEGPLGLDKQTGKPRGFCLFVYKSVESAKKALEEPHKNFEGHIVHCQKAIDGPKHSKGFFNQQHGQPQQQQQQQQNQGYYHQPAKKGRYAGSSGVGHTGAHLMAPSAGPAVPPVGFNPGVPPAALGQAVAALLATQGAGLGIGNLLGGIGGGPQGVPSMMNNPGYGGQGNAGGYGGQPGMQGGGYGGQPPMGQGGVRPHQGGAPYMGHGR